MLYSNEKRFFLSKSSIDFSNLFSNKKGDANSIGYIYDFQHKDLPELFTRQ